MTRRTRKVIPGLKATKAFYPGNLSGIFLSYMNDHIKIRNMLPMHTQNTTLEYATLSLISQMEVS